MKKALVILIAFLPMLSYAKNYGCATAGASMETSLFEALSEQLSIDTSTIVRDKTQVKILDITPVSRTYAEYLARFDFNHYHGSAPRFTSAPRNATIPAFNVGDNPLPKPPRLMRRF
ncbi:hypothetical protein [Atlantibacter hermannii]|uniref:hypothetical protein n=1 Tax=Atlantibacter hermannii TaxID=565 RepID=UPI0028983696|nr:hypothetical protein [Atlantibacter hermannii]